MIPVEILPLGGAGEIGRNCTLLIQGDDMVMIDCGISFPNEEMHGVDVVIPDFDYVVEHRDKLRGVILTHAHEDHVGALSFFLQRVNVPIYATEFTHAMIRPKLDERLDTSRLKLERVKIGDQIKAGGLKFEFIHVTHSIPDSCAVAVHTGHGAVLFTGDFKFDPTPVDEKPSDAKRLKELGQEGVVCLLSDSTNIDRPGYGPSESSVIHGFREAFAQASGRVLITMFASNIHRMQQAMEVAAETGRKVAVAGRRMEQTIDICTKLGYLHPPKGVRIRRDMMADYAPEELVVLTTGSQGEPMSALVQMSKQEYSRMRIHEGDTILYSARPIPGNEAAIWRTINRLFSLGATVIYDQNPSIHVSGHAYREELKKMIDLTNPFYLAPVHGEPRHQYAYCAMALENGHAPHRMFKLQDGHKLIIDETTAWTEPCTDGGMRWIDAGGHVVETRTVRERAALADFGVITCAVAVSKKGIGTIELQAVGFSGFDTALQAATDAAQDALDAIAPKDYVSVKLIEDTMADAIRVMIQRKANLRPMVIPIVICLDSR